MKENAALKETFIQLTRKENYHPTATLMDLSPSQKTLRHLLFFIV